MRKLYAALGILIVLITPLFVIITAVRLVLNPLFPKVEYRMPGFPEDPYGFTLEERLRWSEVAVNYLLNDEGIEFLGDLTFPDGSPLYNERELSHMVDVKVLVQQVFAAWWILLGLLVALGVWAWRGKWLDVYLTSLSTGGWVTAGLVVAVLLLVVTNFSALFTAFHRVFFTGDTWLFLYSDTLIRLFPMRFWQDAFILVGGFTLAAGAALGYFGRRVARRF